MRYGCALVIFAVLFGAGPALAGPPYDPSGSPYPMESAAQHKTRRSISRHHETKAARHNAARHRARTTAKPAIAKVPLPKPVPRAASAATKTETANVEPAKTETAKPATTAPASGGALAGIAPAARLKIEQELFWSGDYSGAKVGGDPIKAAIEKFQRRSRAKVTGTLTGRQRDDLIAAADRHAREYGWRVVTDPATGIRIGLPGRLVPDVKSAAHGTRWSSPHGAIQVETFRYPHANLAKLFAQEKKQPASRKIEHSTLNADNFSIRGTQGLKYFSVRAVERDGEVRGFVFLYDQAMGGVVAPVIDAMANAFAPFPRHALPFATLDSKVAYGTGLIVGADGTIVTARRVTQACQVIVAGGLGNAERVAADKAHGLALLRVYGAGKLPALALPRTEAAPSGKPVAVTLIGIPGPKQRDGGKEPAEIEAWRAGGDSIVLQKPMPLAGFSGAAALDAQGRFLGMMATRSYALASAEPGLPPVQLIPAATLRDFLAAHGVTPTDAPGGNARAAVIRIICVRK
jgi:hypothetical protein